jgi:hypothetical protein
MIYNLGKLISDSEMEVSELARQRAEGREKVRRIKEEVEEIEEGVKRNVRRRDAMAAIAKKLREAWEGNMDIKELAGTFREVKVEFGAEFRELDLESIVPGFVEPAIRKYMDGWELDKDDGITRGLMEEWEGLVGANTIGELVRDVVGNKVERYLETKWDVEDPVVVEDFIEGLKGKGGRGNGSRGRGAESDFVREVESKVRSRVRGYVEREWNPRKGGSGAIKAGAAYRWIATWLEDSIVGGGRGELEDIMPVVRRKMGRAVKEKVWGVDEIWLAEEVERWKGVWDRKSYAAWVDRFVVPAVAERAEGLTVGRGEGTASALESVVVWGEKGVIGEEIWTCVTEVLVRKFVAAMWEWGKEGGASKEKASMMAEWYIGWKSRVVWGGDKGDEVVCRLLNEGLCVIEDLVDGREERGRKRKNLGWTEIRSRRERLSTLRSEKESRERRVRAAESGGGGPGGVSLRDVLESRANELGVDFVQRENRDEEGRVVWKWGDKGTLVRVKDGVVMRKDKGGEWRITGIMELA